MDVPIQKANIINQFFGIYTLMQCFSYPDQTPCSKVGQ